MINYEYNWYFPIINYENKTRIKSFIDYMRDSKGITKTQYNLCIKLFDLISLLPDVSLTYCIPKLVNNQFSLYWHNGKYITRSGDTFSLNIKLTKDKDPMNPRNKIYHFRKGSWTCLGHLS